MITQQGDPAATSLGAFEKWSNYLLVTTVAAVGWVGSSGVTFKSPLIKSATLWAFGVSIVFGIFTLALIPLIAEQSEGGRSIYKTPARFSLLGVRVTMYLTQACRPQHVLFILGILLYCLGTAATGLWLGVAFGGAAVILGVISTPRFSSGAKT
jgi:hypothetical protein